MKTFFTSKFLLDSYQISCFQIKINIVKPRDSPSTQHVKYMDFSIIKRWQLIHYRLKHYIYLGIWYTIIYKYNSI